MTLEMKEVKVMKHNISNGTVRWQIYKSIKSMFIFAVVFTISQILTFQNFDHENVARCHHVQQSQ